MDDTPEPVKRRSVQRGFMYLAGFILLIGGSFMTLAERPTQAFAMCFAGLVWFLVARIVTS